MIEGKGFKEGSIGQDSLLEGIIQEGVEGYKLKIQSGIEIEIENKIIILEI